MARCNVHKLLCVVIVLYAADAQSARTKRTLIYPEGPIHRVQAIMGAGFPVDLEDETVIVGIVIKSTHYLPQNASDYTNPNIIYARKKRSITPLSRWDIYKTLEQYAQMYGYGGRGCILRAICELSEKPIDTSTGIIEEILHTIFTPTSTNEVLDSHSDNEYYAAQNMGRKIKGGCGSLFPDCRGSFVDMFSTFLK